MEKCPTLILFGQQFFLLSYVEADDLACNFRLFPSLDGGLACSVVGVHDEFVPHWKVFHIIKQEWEGRERLCQLD